MPGACTTSATAWVGAHHGFERAAVFDCHVSRLPNEPPVGSVLASISFDGPEHHRAGRIRRA
jgi:hypothetical protein